MPSSVGLHGSWLKSAGKIGQAGGVTAQAFSQEGEK